MNDPNNNNPHHPHQPQALVLAERIVAAGRAHGNNNNTTMTLTDAEIRRAWEIKRSVEERGTGTDDAQNEDLDAPVEPLKDFEYVHFALFCPTNEPIGTILRRISKLQACKREYCILDTAEQGRQMLEQGTRLLPGFLLAIEYLQSSQNYLSVEDWSKFYPAVIETEEQFRIFIGLLYYKFHCKEPHFQAIRNGTSCIIECTGMTLQNNSDIAFIERVLHTFWRWYPRKQRETFWVNSPSVISFWWGLVKRYLPNNQRDTMKFGFQIPGMEGERVDPLYKTPTEEIARENMLTKAQNLLTLRYFNEQTFVLPHLPEDP